MKSAHDSSDSLDYIGTKDNKMNDASRSTAERKPNCLQKAGSVLAGGLELFYYKLGVAIATRPIVTIACVILACLLCTAGLVRFEQSDPSDPIWVDPKSTYIKHKAVVDDRFPSELRISVFIAESDNILTQPALLELYDLHYKVTNISESDYTYRLVCTRFGRGDAADCWSSSILELWEFDREAIYNLTTSDIITTLNDTDKSPVTNADFDPTAYLGGIEYDSSGRIKSAKAATMTYYMQGTNASNSEFVKEDAVTKLTEKFELKFVELAKEYKGTLISKVLAFSTRSFGDEIGDSIFGDVTLLSAGYFIIIVYVALILGRFNCMEMRVYLALGAVLAVGLSIAVSFGLSSGFGIPYGPVQSILPFLLLGLGVDDAFVIIQAWNRLTPDQKRLSIVEQSGHALKHAGVSITVTSITDIVAFGIGATTVLPALRDFCIYAAIGIIAVFIIQATFFIGCVVLDERRRAANRNGCCCCYVHKEDYEPNECSKRDLQQQFFEHYYAPTLIKLPSKIVIIIVSLGLLALGIYGVVYLKQEYDPNIFIPKDSYVKEYFDSYEGYFPDQGADSGFIYLDKVNYYKDASKLTEMIGKFKQNDKVEADSIDSWLQGMVEWLEKTKCPWIKSHLNSTSKWPLDETKFNMLLTPYLYMTSAGRRHIRNIKFNESMTIDGGGDFNLSNIISGSGGGGSPNLNTPEILDMEADFAARYLTTTRVPFTYVDLPDSATKVKAMDASRDIVDDYYTDVNAFPFSRSYENWETDKIIAMELYRNMGLAFGCVVVLTLLLIADIGTCLLVSFCVLSTLVEVGGFMYFWGLAIDTVTCIQLVLAIGLAVDYSAHIGHTFMTVTGNRNERARKTLADIGPAVFNGGFSTLLAFLLLATSNSYVFDVFFRVNLLVVMLGLWNGMVLLPVLLSLMGPSPYLTAESHGNMPTSDSTNKMKMSNSAADNHALEMQTENNGHMKAKESEAMHSNDLTVGYQETNESIPQTNGNLTNNADSGKDSPTSVKSRNSITHLASDDNQQITQNGLTNGEVKNLPSVEQ